MNAYHSYDKQVMGHHPKLHRAGLTSLATTTTWAAPPRQCLQASWLPCQRLVASWGTMSTSSQVIAAERLVGTWGAVSTCSLVVAAGRALTEWKVRQAKW